MDFYAYQRLLGKIQDDAKLRNEFIRIFDTKNKVDMVRFCLLYGKYILETTKIEPCAEIRNGFDAMKEWLDGKCNYQKPRDICWEIYRLAKANEHNPVLKRFYQTMAQLIACPHVKFHGLWASDFGVTLINRIYPNDLEKVKQERKKQIELLHNIM